MAQSMARVATAEAKPHIPAHHCFIYSREFAKVFNAIFGTNLETLSTFINPGKVRDAQIRANIEERTGKNNEDFYNCQVGIENSILEEESSWI